MAKTILGFKTEEVMNRMAQKVTPSLPNKALFPTSQLKMGVGEGRVNGKDVAEISITIRMQEADFSRYLFPDDNQRLINAAKISEFTLVGDEKIMGGFFIVFIKDTSEMLKMKFQTETEARCCIEWMKANCNSEAILNRMKREVEIKKAHQSFSEDNWYTGTNNLNPDTSESWRKLV